MLFPNHPTHQPCSPSTFLLFTGNLSEEFELIDINKQNSTQEYFNFKKKRLNRVNHSRVATGFFGQA